jgi:hypothetical protein
MGDRKMNRVAPADVLTESPMVWTDAITVGKSSLGIVVLSCKDSDKVATAYMWCSESLQVL